ncbi:MAG: 50S ribosomal protein L14e [Candidatus Altiarchaeota archaeon]
MAILDVGRVCRITRGRHTLDYCVVLEKAGKSSVVVEGFETKRGKVNVSHVEPTPTIVDVKKSSSREDVLKALNKAGLN